MRKDEVGWYKTPWGEEPFCLRCHSNVLWEDCDQCGGEGYSGHDCGEDTCCCLNPIDNVECDTCDGEGGWYVCLGCHRALDCTCESYQPTTKEKLDKAAKQNGQVSLVEVSSTDKKSLRRKTK